MTKYVIFEMASIYLPVIIPEHITHKQIQVKGARPISAGFFQLERFNLVKVSNYKSESLNLGPLPRDQKLLQGIIDEQDTSFYLKLNHK